MINGILFINFIVVDHSEFKMFYNVVVIEPSSICFLFLFLKLLCLCIIHSKSEVFTQFFLNLNYPTPVNLRAILTVLFVVRLGGSRVAF